MPPPQLPRRPSAPRTASPSRAARCACAASVAVALTSACSAPPTFPNATLTLGPTRQASRLPPPIAGGTLLVLRDGRTAIAADPDGDAVYAVDLEARAVRWAARLASGDQPGRAAEDAAGRVHVVLRGGGAVATLDAATGAVTARRAVCAAPRGIAYGRADDALAVACAGGELVTLPAAGDAPAAARAVRPDLRDAVYDGDALVLTTFRTAEFVRPPGADGATFAVAPAPYSEDRVTSVARNGAQTHATVQYTPDLAWRAVPLPGGGVAMLHQRAESSSVAAGAFVSDPLGWGGAPTCQGCSCSVVHAVISTLAPGASAPRTGLVIPTATVPVDLAVTADGASFAVVAAGNFSIPRLPEVLVLDAGAAMGATGCADAARTARPPQGQATSVAFDARGALLVQTRAPAALWFESSGTAVVLDPTDTSDTGHALFHANTGTFVACASCHAEGGDDGHVWTFDEPRDARRTMSLRGGLLAAAPFHWRGEIADVPALMRDVFVTRMGAQMPAAAELDALGRWLDALPPTPVAPPADAASVARGRALFEGSTAGCARCHAGPLGTNNSVVDVGTGGMFKVPRLRDLANRAPYMHNGCAATLADRFDPVCGGRAHGQTADLSADQRADLVAYLRTL